MNAYYNELETFPCKVIKTNIDKGRLPHGFVDNRDIREVDAIDILGHSQYHLFAGIGAAAYACRLAGIPDDFSICTFGFPCQDISSAGKGAGIDGERSGLFFEAVRIIRVLKPTWLLVENVAALRTRGIERVIEELESAAYCVLPPIVVGADDIGAPHRRKRVWIVCRLANADGRGQQQPQGLERKVGRRDSNGGDELEHADRRSSGASGQSFNQAESAGAFIGTGSELAYANNATGQEQWYGVADATPYASPRCDSFAGWPSRPGQPQHEWEEPRTTQSSMGRSASGTSRRLARHRRDALKALGNCWVPQAAVPILQWIHRQEVK